MNDIETTASEKQKARKQNERPLQREAIEEHWKQFERKQCELMQEAGIALSRILDNKHYM